MCSNDMNDIKQLEQHFWAGLYLALLLHGFHILTVFLFLFLSCIARVLAILSRLRNDLYYVEWDVKLYSTILY